MILSTALALMAASIAPPTAESKPYRQPQAASAHGVTAMVFGSGASLFYSASADAGRTFQAPVKIGDTGALALGRHRGPRLVILKDALVVTAIAGERVATGPHAHGLPEAGNLMVWRSTDRGRTWAQTGMINDVPGAAREGLHAITARPDGKLVAVWLDLREKGTRLYGAESADGGRTWSKNTLVYESPEGTICQCCHPSLASDGKGQLWAMWRNVVEGSRDMYVMQLGAKEPKKLGDGTWKINACPMDGGGFVIDGGKIASAWRRDGEVYLQEAGKAEQRLGTGKDVAMARGKAGIYVAWTREGAIEVKRPGAESVDRMGTEAAFVSLTPLEDGAVLAAWESRGAIETRRLD